MRYLRLALAFPILLLPLACSSHKETPPAAFAFLRTPRFDDSGFGTLQTIARQIRDPRSLEHIRTIYEGAGRREIAKVLQNLERSDLLPTDRYESLLRLAQLYLYEGQFAKAPPILEQARAVLEANPDALQGQLPNLVFLQGVAGLRLGETENCVECQCRGSCIFPLESQAYHQKPDGSRAAIRYFTEYLERRPDDLGTRWLLNLAYMTVGEYPAKVPPQHLISPDHFRPRGAIGKFTDVAPALGLNRFNQAGGVILDDFHGAGLFDVLMTTWDATQSMRLYRNKGDGTFEDRTQAACLEGQLGGLNCVQADYNNDGHLDFYICRGAWTDVPMRPSLLRNNGDGTFTDVTAAAGLLTPIAGQVAVWADYDNDGWLDLFVGNEAGPSKLYHNKGDGTFEDVSDQAGITRATTGVRCKGANWGDFNGDRFPDLFINNQAGAPRLLRNNRDGTFTDVAPELGITKPTMGFGCWFFDYDNDGWPDLLALSFDPTLTEVVKSLTGQPVFGDTTRLYRNLEGKGFRDVSRETGLDVQASPMGANWGDLNGDGYPDVYLGTGDPKYSLLVPNRLFVNEGGRRFVDATYASGTGSLQKGHAVAIGDWDRDGNLDLFAMLGGATPGDSFRNAFFQNPGHGHRWLTVKLTGKKTNRSAIGARIKVTVGDPPRNVYRWVTTGGSFGGNPLTQTIGLGKADGPATVEVYWPTSDTTQTFRGVALDQAIAVTEFAAEYQKLNWTKVPGPR